MQQKISSLINLICLLLTVLSATALHAAALSIAPVKVLLWPEQNSDAVRLGNKGDVPVNVQITAKTWSMDETGKFVETDTGDFVFFPRLLTLAPAEEKSVRVGYNGDFPAQEKPYRLLIEELPPVLKPAQQEEGKVGFGLQYSLRLSVPVFVMPGKEPTQAEVAIEGINLGEKIITIPPKPVTSPLRLATGPEEKTVPIVKVGVKSPGNYHVQVKNVELQWLDAKGQTVTSTESGLLLLRVLPKLRVFVEVPPPANCQGAQTLRVKVNAEKLNEPYTQNYPLTKGRCYP